MAVDGDVPLRARRMRLVVLAVVVGGLVVGGSAPGGSFVEAVGVEIGSAALLFGAFQLLAPSWRPNGRETAIALGGGVALLALAWVQGSAFWQALLLALGAGVALFIALDGFVGDLLDQARAIERAKAEQEEREREEAREQAARDLRDSLTVRLRQLTGDNTAELSLDALMRMEIWGWLSDQNLYESHELGRYPWPSLPAVEDPEWIEAWSSRIDRPVAPSSDEGRGADSPRNGLSPKDPVDDEQPPPGAAPPESLG